MLLSIDLLSYSLRRSGWSRFVSTFLLFYSQIIITEFSLGLFSVLGIYSLAALNILLSTGIVFAVRWRFGRKTLSAYISNAWQSLVAAKSLVRKDPLWGILIFLAVAFVGWIIFLGVIFPIHDFDGYSYHLTYIGNLIQNHTFLDAPTSLTWLTGYPKGGEFIQAWSVLLTHSDMLSELSQIPFLLLGVYALYELSTRIGAYKKQARFAAILFVFLPVVLNQLKTTYVDVMLCSLFFAGLAMVVRRKLKRLDFVLIGIIFSLLISLKPTGILFVLALIPLLLWNVYKSYGRVLRSYLWPLLLVILPAFFGLYWYIKNLLVYGNPIYPFGFKLAGVSIFSGRTFQELAATAVQSTSLPNEYLQRIWFVWTEQKDWFGCLYNYDTNYAGLGPIWFIILVPAVVLSIFFAIKQRNALFAAVTLTIITLFAVYPANYYSRYTMFITAIGVMALALTMTHTRWLTNNLIRILCIFLALFIILTNFALCNFGPLAVKEQIKSLDSSSPERGSHFSIFPGRAFVELEKNVQPGDVVVYDSKPFFIYPLWESDFSNRVVYIPAPDNRYWLKELANISADYVFTTFNSPENNWAEGKLESIYKDEMYEIFKVN